LFGWLRKFNNHWNPSWKTINKYFSFSAVHPKSQSSKIFIVKVLDWRFLLWDIEIFFVNFKKIQILFFNLFSLLLKMKKNQINQIFMLILCFKKTNHWGIKPQNPSPDSKWYFYLIEKVSLENLSQVSFFFLFIKFLKKIWDFNITNQVTKLEFQGMYLINFDAFSWREKKKQSHSSSFIPSIDYSIFNHKTSHKENNFLKLKNLAIFWYTRLDLKGTFIFLT